jgi:hypothetical protein
VEIFEPFATVLGFGQFKALDHGTHGAIEHSNAFGQNRG